MYWNPEFESHPQRYGLTPQSAAVQRVVEAEKTEAERRKREYRGHMPGLQLQGKTVILVDDGVAVSAALRQHQQAAGRALTAAALTSVVAVGCGRLEQR